MKHIKKFNEMFDSEEIKSQNELDIMRINLKDIVSDENIMKISSSEIERLHSMLMLEFPFFQKYDGKEVDGITWGIYTVGDVYHFVTKNSKYFVTISFKSVGTRYEVGITYNTIKSMLIRSITDDMKTLTDKIHFKDFGILDISGISRVIKNVFVPILEMLGFVGGRIYSNRYN
jgi:hypothetical protein